jgi:hypothetical protein
MPAVFSNLWTRAEIESKENENYITNIILKCKKQKGERWTDRLEKLFPIYGGVKVRNIL